MAKAKNNPILQKVSGPLGETIVFRRTVHGTVMANAPRKPVKYHPVQLALQGQFRDGVKYANRAKVHDEARAIYATGITRTNRSVYQVALTDYLKAPEIRRIVTDEYKGRTGDVIYVYASDNFRVSAVSVVITNSVGEEIEQGDAVLSEVLRNVWIYTITSDNRSLEAKFITAKARDIPGNVAMRTLTLET